MNSKNQMVQYHDSFSILVINHWGKMRRLYTPFRVKCLSTTGDIQENSTLYVDEVIEDEDDKLLYKICGNLHVYTHFSITVSF